jgi:hypothetical protein
MIKIQKPGNQILKKIFSLVFLLIALSFENVNCVANPGM